MKYDWYTTDTENFVDQKHKMMNEQNADWNPNGDFGQGDSIGRNFRAYYLYNDKRFVEGVLDCWTLNKKTQKYEGKRYPNSTRTDLSRDHVLNTVLLFKLANNRNTIITKDFLKNFVKRIPWKISEKFNLNPTLWFYFRSIASFKWAIPLYYICIFAEMGIATYWNKLLFSVGNLDEELSQDEYSVLKLHNTIPKLTKFQKSCSSLLYPNYTILQFAWQLYFLKNSRIKKLLVKMVSSIVQKHNYVIQLLLQTKNQPTSEQVYSYRSMKGGRWTSYLSSLTNRDLNVIKDKWPNEAKTLLKSNVMDVDLVRALFEKR